MVKRKEKSFDDWERSEDTRDGNKPERSTSLPEGYDTTYSK